MDTLTEPPAPSPPPPAPRRLENALSRMLILGIGFSASVIGVGVIGVLAASSGDRRVDYSRFVPPDGSNNALRGVVEGVTHANFTAILMLGVLLVIATPVARVVLSLAAFAMEKDRLYVLITGIVLAILCYSLFLGQV